MAGHHALSGQHAALQHGLGVAACDPSERGAPLLRNEASAHGPALPLEAGCRGGHAANPQQYGHALNTCIRNKSYLE